MNLIYMAHPIGGDLPGNIANAKKWLTYLYTVRYREWMVIAPYLLDLEVIPLDDDIPEQRNLGMNRNLEVVQRCDGIVLVGGRISSGMKLELEAARRWGKMIFDWTNMGFAVPSHL